MKIVVDKIPKSIYDCLFFCADECGATCKLDRKVRESPCGKDNYCPYLMTVETYLKKRGIV